MTAAPIPTCTEHVDALLREAFTTIFTAILNSIEVELRDSERRGSVEEQLKVKIIRSIVRQHAAAAGITLDGD